jgi:hypothetical protein
MPYFEKRRAKVDRKTVNSAMILSHMLSDAALAAVGFWVFATSFQHVPFYSRLLWGFFFSTIALSALLGVFTFGGLDSLEPIHQSLTLLAGSLGVVCVVVAVYSRVMQQPASRGTFVLATAVGVGLFVGLLISPTFGLFAPVVSALGMLLVMLLAVYGLRQKLSGMGWLIGAVMLMALATKASSFPLPLHPTDTYHYLIAIGLLCFGKSEG